VQPQTQSLPKHAILPLNRQDSTTSQNRIHFRTTTSVEGPFSTFSREHGLAECE